MDRILAGLVFLVILVVSIYTYPEQAGAVLMIVITSSIAIVLIHHLTEESGFLQRIFIIGLLLRIIIGLVIHIFDLREFFGGDALQYDQLANRLYSIWFEDIFTNDALSSRAMSMTVPGWGMHWLVGIIYSITGPNILAAQFFCAVVGAGTAPMLYGCALKIFGNRNVAKMSAIFVAVFPACVLWSSQLLKDGLIIFLLVLVMTMVLKLQEKFDYLSLVILILSLFAIISLRFYIFYVIAVAVVGSFVIGSSKNQQTIVKRLAACLLIGAGLAYLGGIRTVSENFEQFGDLKRIQRGREWSSTVSGSGYGEGTDISTTEGAIATLPVGFAYLMFAPFPWQATNVRQAISIPETLLWWASMPLLVIGFLYTIRYRLRNAIAIVVFTMLLTVALSLTQSNVGTAYRMRTQIQVFLFMFIAVGWQLRKEKKEIAKIESSNRRKRLEDQIRRVRKESDETDGSEDSKDR